MEIKVGSLDFWPAGGDSEANLLSLLIGLHPRLPVAARNVEITFRRHIPSSRSAIEKPKEEKDSNSVSSRIAERAVALLQALSVTVEETIVKDEVCTRPISILEMSTALGAMHGLKIPFGESP